MRTSLVAGAAALGVGLLASSSALGAVVTFGFSNVDRLDLEGVRTEAGFTYEATIGTGWELQTVRGNPGAALSTFFNDEPSVTGDTVVFKDAGNADFTFHSVDWRSNSSSAPDQVLITGLLNGSTVGTLALNSGSTIYTTVVPTFAGQLIDELRVTISNKQESAMHMDNFVFNIPEPTTAMIGMVAVGLLACRRRRAR